ncbi:hypothetical protein INT47_010043, partial [Mucor saturninus]
MPYTLPTLKHNMVHYPSRSKALVNSGPLSVKIQSFSELWSVMLCFK